MYKKDIMFLAGTFLYLVGFSATYNYLAPGWVAEAERTHQEAYVDKVNACALSSEEPYSEEYYAYVNKYDMQYGNPRTKCLVLAKTFDKSMPKVAAFATALIWPVSAAIIGGKHILP